MLVGGCLPGAGEIEPELDVDVDAARDEQDGPEPGEDDEYPPRGALTVRRPADLRRERGGRAAEAEQRDRRAAELHARSRVADDLVAQRGAEARGGAGRPIQVRQCEHDGPSGGEPGPGARAHTRRPGVRKAGTAHSANPAQNTTGPAPANSHGSKNITPSTTTAMPVTARTLPLRRSPPVTARCRNRPLGHRVPRGREPDHAADPGRAAPQPRRHRRSPRLGQREAGQTGAEQDNTRAPVGYPPVGIRVGDPDPRRPAPMAQ